MFQVISRRIYILCLVVCSFFCGRSIPLCASSIKVFPGLVQWSGDREYYVIVRRRGDPILKSARGPVDILLAKTVAPPPQPWLRTTERAGFVELIDAGTYPLGSVFVVTSDLRKKRGDQKLFTASQPIAPSRVLISTAAKKVVLVFPFLVDSAKSPVVVVYNFEGRKLWQRSLLEIVSEEQKKKLLVIANRIQWCEETWLDEDEGELLMIVATRYSGPFSNDGGLKLEDAGRTIKVDGGKVETVSISRLVSRGLQTAEFETKYSLASFIVDHEMIGMRSALTRLGKSAPESPRIQALVRWTIGQLATKQ